MIRGKRILITGGAGFIGSYLVERWVEDNKIVVVDNFTQNIPSFTHSSPMSMKLPGKVFEFP